MSTNPDKEALVEAVARAICKSNAGEGFQCCQWPAQMGRTKPCPSYLVCAVAAIESAKPLIEKALLEEQLRWVVKNDPVVMFLQIFAKEKRGLDLKGGG